MTRSWSAEATVVGLKFRTNKEERVRLSRSSFAITLEREPGNEYDENAIMVRRKSNEKHIGYLRREIAELLALKLDSGSVRFKSGIVQSVDVDRGEGQAILRFQDVPKPSTRTKKPA